MHFVSMLALDLGIPVSYNIPVTILSAIVAILATFTTFGYELVVHYIRKLRRTAELKRMMQPSHSSESERLFPAPPPELDSAAGLDDSEVYDSVSPMSEMPPDLPGSTKTFGTTGPSRRRWTGANHSDENFLRYHMSADDDSEYPADHVNVTATTTLRPTFTSAQNLSALGWTADQARLGSVVHFEDSSRTVQPSPVIGYPTSTSYPPGTVGNFDYTPSTSHSSHPDPFAFERSSNGSFSSETLATLFGPGVGKPWTGEDELSPISSRSASIVHLAKVVATRFTYKVVIKGVLMGLAVVSMHYTGMGAMRMEGTIVWNWWLVALSVLDACLVCMIAIIFSKSNLPRACTGTDPGSQCLCLNRALQARSCSHLYPDLVYQVCTTAVCLQPTFTPQLRPRIDMEDINRHTLCPGRLPLLHLQAALSRMCF